MAEAMASGALVSIGHEWLYSGVGDFSRPPLPPTPQPLLLCQKKATAEAMASVALVSIGHEWLCSGVGGFSRPPLLPTLQPLLQR